MSHIKITIESSGYGWRAEGEIGPSPLTKQPMQAKTRTELFDMIEETLDRHDAERKRAPTQRPSPVDAPPRVILAPASRRVIKARALAEAAKQPVETPDGQTGT